MYFDDVADAIKTARWQDRIVTENFVATRAKLLNAEKKIAVVCSIYSNTFTEQEWEQELADSVETVYVFTDVDGDEQEVTEKEYRALLRKREIRVLAFTLPGYVCTLTLNGTLKVGCQDHRLSVWEGEEGRDIIMAEGFDIMDDDGVYANRDKLFALLRGKLTRERARKAKAR